MKRNIILETLLLVMLFLILGIPYYAHAEDYKQPLERKISVNYDVVQNDTLSYGVWGIATNGKTTVLTRYTDDGSKIWTTKDGSSFVEKE